MIHISFGSMYLVLCIFIFGSDGETKYYQEMFRFVSLSQKFRFQFIVVRLNDF